ncbi:SPOSA6832_03749, partial [Sporobolomyces salmonicolor]
MLRIVLAALPAIGAVTACSHDLAHLGRRAVNAAATTTADRTTESGEAQITNQKEECTAYTYEPVASVIGTYPTIWQTANISQSGISQADRELFYSLNSSIPDIAPRGTRAGNFSGVVYNSSDPDCWWSWDKCTTPKLPGLDPDIIKCEEPETWGLGFDDGPNCSHNAFYDYLESLDQKATMFCASCAPSRILPPPHVTLGRIASDIGSNVLDWPLEAQRGLADGHEMYVSVSPLLLSAVALTSCSFLTSRCAHTWSHPYMTALTNEQAFAELYFSKKAIKEILGITLPPFFVFFPLAPLIGKAPPRPPSPTDPSFSPHHDSCWRPPYGDVDDRIRYIAKALDLRTIVWNEDTNDWDWTVVGMPAVRANYEHILAGQKAGNFSDSGTIVLTHELNNGTMSMVEEFLPQIRQQFTGGVMPIGVCNKYVFGTAPSLLSPPRTSANSLDQPLSLSHHSNTQPYVETASYTYPSYSQWVAGTHSIALAAPTATTSANLVFVSDTLMSTAATATATATTSNGGATKAGQQGAVSTGASGVAGKAAMDTSGAGRRSAFDGGLGAGVAATVVIGSLVGALAVL